VQTERLVQDQGTQTVAIFVKAFDGGLTVTHGVIHDGLQNAYRELEPQHDDEFAVRLSSV